MAELQDELISLTIENRIPENTFELVTNKQQTKKADSPGTIPVSKNKYSELFTMDNNGPQMPPY